MLWFGSWLVGSIGEEGSWFYSGRGDSSDRYPVPDFATGLRIRRWPNEGLDAEYVDLVPAPVGAELEPAQLDFDARQGFSLLPAHVS